MRTGLSLKGVTEHAQVQIAPVSSSCSVAGVHLLLHRGPPAAAAWGLPAAPLPRPRCPGTPTWSARTCARTSWRAAAGRWPGSRWAWSIGMPCQGPPLARAGCPVPAWCSCLLTQEATGWCSPRFPATTCLSTSDQEPILQRAPPSHEMQILPRTQVCITELAHAAHCSTNKRECPYRQQLPGPERPRAQARRMFMGANIVKESTYLLYDSLWSIKVEISRLQSTNERYAYAGSATGSL